MTSRNELYTLSKHLKKRLAPMKLVGSFILSLSVSGITAIIVGKSMIEEKQILTDSVAPYISSLIEIQDRLEIQRFISSLAEKENLVIEVIQNGAVLASSSDLSRVQSTHTYLLEEIGKVEFEYPFLVHSSKVQRKNGPRVVDSQLVVFVPIYSAIATILASFVACFLLSHILVTLLTWVLEREAVESLIPVDRLNQAIRNLNQFPDDPNIKPFKIWELEQIRESVLEVNQSLLVANEKLAETKAKGLLVGMYEALIHDLKGPMVGLRIWLKILNKNDAPEEMRTKALSKIEEHSEQVFRQVQSSRSQLGIQVEIKKNQCLSSVAKSVADDISLEMRSRGRPVQISTNIEQTVRADYDPGLIKRAIQNLAFNALEACKNKVQISIGKTEEGLPWLAVSDDGPGLSSEAVSLHLQGRGKSTKANRKGIGLFSANHIIRSHGGRIIYKTSKYGGASFEILLGGLNA